MANDIEIQTAYNARRRSYDFLGTVPEQLNLLDTGSVYQLVGKLLAEQIAEHVMKRMVSALNTALAKMAEEAATDNATFTNEELQAAGEASTS
jgi:hypothetical protein